MPNTKTAHAAAPTRFDGLTIMERLRALREFKQRINGKPNIPVRGIREHLRAGSPPAYYDTIRLIDIAGGGETLVGTIDLRDAKTGPGSDRADPAGGRIAGWGSIGEMPVDRPRTIDLFVVVKA